eukprot:CAMPEP_0117581066 /NCGR_PEP_ID=MMETSP0784-20121206/65591_1 /TAXON_ID=39447 /ORGANISM="" /LENGTH=52 /DNA_ID=CAMNT_0005381277 /DNA_START=151 /DNA_END=309 /DNA_ORIENTATION=-
MICAWVAIGSNPRTPLKLEKSLASVESGGGMLLVDVGTWVEDIPGTKPTAVG